MLLNKTLISAVVAAARASALPALEIGRAHV